MLKKTDNQNTPLVIYNTQTISKQKIQENFVLRKELYNLLLDDLNSSEIKFPDHHFLIQGIRGSGKTFFLMKLFYDIQDSKKLENLIPVLLKEEEYFISSLANLWLRISEELKYTNSIFDDLFTKMENIFEKQIRNKEKELFKIIKTTLKKHNKKIILLIDNIQDIFNIIGEKDTKIFKKNLLNSNVIQIIGATSVTLESSFNYAKPFFDFFKKIHLKELNLQETKQLILHLGVISNNKQIKIIVEKEQNKIEALRRLTEGVPRTIVLLFEIFLTTKNITTYNYLQKIIDGTTPLYKHKMDNTIPSHKPIIDVIARNWDGITAKEISKKTRQKTSLISAHLAKLEKNDIVLKQKTSTKNNIYFLKERFFNIWYLLRLGRNKEKKKIIWVTRFLELWCSNKEISDKSEEYYKIAIKKGSINALYQLTVLYFHQNIKKDQAMELILKAIEKDNTNFYYLFTYIFILIWHNKIKQALPIIQKILKNKDFFKKYQHDCIEIIIFLISKNQLNITLELINSFNLREKLKPVYYALMILMKDEYKDEYLKMGPELKTTVNEILEKIKTIKEKYRN